MAIGILGGSFSPPHRGHLALARRARAELGLERVLLMPLHTPPHKPPAADPGPLHRLAMVRLAVAGEEGLCACGLEIERGGVSYTAATLQELHDREPQDELTFIVGADTAATIPAWHEPATVLRLARLAIAERPGTRREDVLAALRGLAAEQPPRIEFLSMEPVEASSSLARERLGAGEGVEDLLAAPVLEYIELQGLYGARAA